jgi:uncharacterized phiE125 gp8 family phage protein
MYDPIVVAAAATAPVSLSEVKAHLKIDGDDDDDLFPRMIEAAREACETYTGRALLTQTLRLHLDAWPNGASAGRIVELPRPPLQSVTHVAVYDDAGGMTTVDSNRYVVAMGVERPGRVVLKPGWCLPPAGRAADAIEIEYVAGYGPDPDDAPEPIRHGMLILIGHWYENREGSGALPLMPALPVGTVALWRPYRLLGLS